MPRDTNKPQMLSHQISNRLLATVLAAWLAIAGLAAAGLVGFSQTDRAYSRVLRQAEALQASALNLNTAMVTEMLNTRAFLISGEENAATRRRLAHQEAVREFEALKLILSTEPSISAPSLSRLVALHNEYDSIADRLIELRTAGRTTEALQLFDGQSDPLVLAMQPASQTLQNEIRQGMLEINTAYSRRTSQMIWLLAGFFLGSLALSGLILIRWVSPLLRAFNDVERALINSAETQVYQPIVIGPEKPFHLVTAYNHLAHSLLESNTAILKYVRYLHHEMNTLLASVLGYGHMLADPNLRPPDASMEEYGKVIVQQAQRTVNLVEDFTLAARIEGYQYFPTLLPLRLAPLLASLIDEMSACPAGLPVQEYTRREILLSGCPDTVWVLADALSLENALRKVIENALKFSPSEKPVYISVELTPRQVQIHVQDQGCGIAPDDLPLLFHPFSRLNNEINRCIPGNGLGLYLASAILRAHRGGISIQSRVGMGSVFTLSLPLETV